MGLPGELKRLLWMNVVSQIIFIYIGIFVNLYIWEQGHRIFDVSWFNFSLFLTWGFAFAIGARLLHGWSIRLLFAISAISGGIAFLLLFFLHLDNRMLWILLIGIPVGSMWGFFSCAQNLSLSLFGKGKDFENYFALTSTIGQIINVTVPIVSAVVVQYFGYAGSFIFMLVFIVCMLSVSQLLPGLSLKGRQSQDQEISWIQGMRYRHVFYKPSLRWMVPSCLAAGIFLQFQGLFALLFTFNVTNDKLLIALLNTLYTVCSLGALFLFRKVRWQAKTWLLLGMILLSIGFTILVFPSKPIFIISNVLTTVGMFYYTMQWNAQHFRVVSTCPAVVQAKILVWRECLLVVSRCLLLLCVLPMQNFSGAIFIVLIALTMACIVSILYFQKRSISALGEETSNS